ncbi:hypothetical protein [uncultured Caulobacter sp.]|uniref:hypothetical protein n=1 Tax=uncultured Caulobacter sp. TaxID=158749 RepID=UPI00262D5544|nr:hypothetical protein [uncultured Caulobacter sp.]
MSDVARVQVLLQPAEAERFERYCSQTGHKKSTLIARLIREHLDREQFEIQPLQVVRRAVG